MAGFYPAVTTDVGIALAADLLVGENIEFTKLVTGSGVYEGEDLVRTNLQKATALKKRQQEFGFSSIEKMTDSCVLLKSLLTNKDLAEGYRIREIGVYARKRNDEDAGDGILYSISVAQEPDYLPPYNGMFAIEINQDYYITVSDASEVTIQARGAVALLEDFEKFREEMRKKLDEMNSNIQIMVEHKMIDLQSQIGNLAELMTVNKGCLVDAINEIAEVVRPLVEYGYATSQDIDDIIAGIFEDDIDWVSSLETASRGDIAAIIAGTFVDEEETGGENMASSQDIDDIIAGTFVEETEDLENADMADQEIDQIIANSFK